MSSPETNCPPKCVFFDPFLSTMSMIKSVQRLDCNGWLLLLAPNLFIEPPMLSKDSETDSCTQATWYSSSPFMSLEKQFEVLKKAEFRVFLPSTHNYALIDFSEGVLHFRRLTYSASVAFTLYKISRRGALWKSLLLSPRVLILVCVGNLFKVRVWRKWTKASIISESIDKKFVSEW